MALPTATYPEQRRRWPSHLRLVLSVLLTLPLGCGEHDAPAPSGGAGSEDKQSWKTE